MTEPTCAIVLQRINEELAQQAGYDVMHQFYDGGWQAVTVVNEQTGCIQAVLACTSATHDLLTAFGHLFMLPLTSTRH